MAMPHLYGGPAYSRPSRPAPEIARPFDPDELPLEAERSDGDAARADQLAGKSWAPASAPKAKASGKGSAKGSRRGGGIKSDKSASPAGPAGPANGSGGLEGRPFRLRGLGRIFRSESE